MSSAPLVVTLGDLLLDVVCRPQGPIAHDTDTPAIVTVDAGGQAANVAAWAVRAGARGRLVSLVARDGAGRLALQQLALRGVEAVGPRVEHGGGVVVVLVRPDGARDMLTDRGVAPSLSAEHLEPAWFAGAAALHVTGYALSGAAMHGAAREAARLAHEAGAIVSVDCAGVALIDEVGPQRFRDRLAATAPDVVLGTARELERLGGAATLAATVVEKRGPDGAVLHAAGAATEVAAVAAVSVDTTGAGDALAGGLLARVAQGASAAEALRGAVDDAALCVATPGAMPALQ